MEKSITLLHVSDLHFYDESLLLKDLIQKEGIFSKRITGWLNHRINRSGHFQTETRDRLINYLTDTDWDYLIFSGDLTTLSLEQEFSMARKQLEPLLQKGTVIMTPGNHDRYTKNVLNPDLMAQAFSDCFPFNQNQSPAEGIRYLELSDKVVLFEIEMSRPRFHHSSRGEVQTDLNANAAFIAQNYPGWLKLIVGHYPAFLPENVREGAMHKLAGKNRLQQFLINNDIDIYLHGHVHQTWQITPPNEARPVCLNAGGCCRYASGPGSGFYKITITGKQVQITRIELPDST